ncbi:hypothetical protein PQR53_33785 [Paraburkholderia fungorum]|uniref:hypothetical protein n=1 Tax=Paraburkholderia fungorum TaxID=134537 RepID=UPI0038B823A1
MVGAVHPLTSGGGTTATGSMSRPGLIQRSNRAGFLAGNLAGSGINAIKHGGSLAHAKDKQEANQYGLQLGKDIANGVATGIDWSRVPNKKDMGASYLGSPRRQGVYEVPQHPGHATSGGQIELKSMRNAPKDRGTQTVQPQTTHAGTQPTSTSKSDAGTQVQPNQAVKQTQAHTPTRSQASQATPQTHDASGQTTSPAHAGTQTQSPPVPGHPDHDRPRSAGEHASHLTPNDPRGPASSANSHKATQTAQGSQTSQGTVTQAPSQTDAEVQSKAATRDRGSQHVPASRSVLTQTAVQTTSAGSSSPQTGPIKADASEQTHETNAATDKSQGTKTTTATQAGTSQVVSGTQTDAGATQASQHRPASQHAATQSTRPSVRTSATQHTAVHKSVQSQTQVKSMSAETQTGSNNSKNTQTHSDVHHVGTQSQHSTGESATQAKPRSSNKSIQTQPRVKEAGTQTHQLPGASAQQAGSSDRESQGGEAAVGTQTTSDHAGGASSRAPGVPNSVKGNGHWVLADGVSLAADINNVKNRPNLASITAVTAGSVMTAGDTLALINTSGSRVLTLASKSLSLLGTAIGLAPSVGQLANDVKQLILNPKDEQSKWNVANSTFQLGGGLAATAASLVFPPAALLPIVFPNLAEIGHAEILRGKKNDLLAQGLKTEAGAVEDRYKIAALDATPVVNWFSSTYTPELRPVIENFEKEQGNVPGGKPAGELPVNTLHDPRVYDYYGQAITERAQRLADAAKDYLKGIASGSNLSSVTMVSRCPQVFGWPTSGQAMRVFDRAVAISYDRVHDTIHAELFGADKDGTYRLPTRDPSLPSGKGSKNLLFYTNMLDPDAKQVKFDMPQYLADPGTFAIDVHKSAVKA